MLLVAATGCIDIVDARWQLDHDHVVAVRATPPRVMAAERARLDALIAHEGGTAMVEAPSHAVGPQEPAELHDLVAFIDGEWTVTAPNAETLAAIRPQLGIAADEPVPLDVVMAFERPAGDPLYAKKTVWLGARAENPTVPAMVIDGQLAADEVVVPMQEDVYVSVTVDPAARVNWLTSCGTLFQDDVATAFLHVLPEDRTDGELAVVVRSPDGGVAWRVWPLRARPR